MSLLGALSAIREVAISKFFDFLLDKLVSFEFLQFVSEQHIQEELEKLKKELLEIRALLDDAEERQLKDQSVEFWLSDLLNLAYDVDDIVDELETETSRRNLMLECRGSSSKKPKLISDSFNVVMFNRGMASKIKDISAKLKNLEPQKNQLQLRMIDCSKSNRMKERQQPTSLQIETHVYGRDKDKEAILELVFKSDDEGNFVIPIVGMGGIGKTTLAQLVYNDATIQNHFDIKAWVCVSDDFDVTRITKAIFQSVTSEPCNDDDLNSLQEKLKKKLSEKNFLIVLDDVWNENYHNWTILQSPFLTRTPGSKIIVTTRSFAVSSTVGASLAHSLQVLSEDDCLSVFAQHALGAIDFGGHPNLKEVAEKIVRKCDGLPLAAKTLGDLLRTNVDHDVWKDILESELWKLSDHRCGIIPALQLNFCELWNFCEVDEEARKFPRLRLLLIQNCPKLLGSIPENLPCLEKLVIFNCEKLVISIQSLPMLSELKIHRCHQVVYKGFADDRSLRSVYFSKIPKFTCAADWLMLGSTKVESLEIDDCEELCSLRENNWGLLTQSMSLVYLTIRNWPQLVSIGAEEEKEELMQLKIPGSIEQMRIENCERLEKLSTRLHYITSLRVLELLSCPKLISLSKSNLPLHLKRLVINKCENLQRLLLDEGENVNSISACLLEQLDVRNCPCLVSLSSRGELPTRLKQLRIWCCAKLESIAQEIQDSSSLEYIQIVECCNIKYLPQGLNKLSHLRNIHVSDCSNLVSFPKSGLITPNLKVLSLGFCQKLQSLPDGMHNLNCLEELKITNCSSLTCFPEEGIPTNLRELVIEGPNICKPLIKWGLHRLASLEILSIQNGCPDAESFPQEEIGMMLPCSLTRLDIFNLPKLQILSSKGFQYLPCLEYLSIGHCPNLKSLPEKNMLSSLLRLDIWNCPLLNERFEKKGPEWSKIAHIPCVQIDDRYIYDSS